MTSSQQRAALQRQIWQIANDVRGAVDGWDFKQYVLGTLFYRFISENFANYIEGGDDSIHYAELGDEVITPEIKNDKFIFYYITNLYNELKSKMRNYGMLNLATLRQFKIPIPPIEEQARIVAILDKFDTLANSISEGLPREIELRQKQYEYYRDLLLSFPKPEVV